MCVCVSEGGREREGEIHRIRYRFSVTDSVEVRAIEASNASDVLSTEKNRYKNQWKKRRERDSGGGFLSLYLW